MEAQTKSGFLFKQGFAIKRWRKRYFIAESGFLYYFKSNKGKERACGVIPLRSCSIEWTSAQREKYGFVIKSIYPRKPGWSPGSGNWYHLSTCDVADRDEWMQGLLSARNLAQLQGFAMKHRSRGEEGELKGTSIDDSTEKMQRACCNHPNDAKDDAKFLSLLKEVNQSLLDELRCILRQCRYPDERLDVYDKFIKTHSINCALIAAVCTSFSFSDELVDILVMSYPKLDADDHMNFDFIVKSFLVYEPDQRETYERLALPFPSRLTPLTADIDTDTRG